MNVRRPLHVLLSVVLLAALAGCSSDSPTRPQANPVPPPDPGPSTPVGAFSITVQTNPGQIPTDFTEPVVVTVTVRRTDNNQPPPNRTTVLISANRGSFGSAGAGQTSVVAELFNGQVVLEYFPGTAEGTATIRAQLENSTGQGTVLVRQEVTAAFFLSTVEPNTGRPEGGDTVTITGGGFDGPFRVLFGGQPATVLSASGGRLTVRTPQSANPVPVNSTLTVPVSVTINFNETEGTQTDTLNNAFTYVPGGGGGPVNRPQIFSVTPTVGPNEGGTPVRIVGNGFEAPVQVLFGDLEGTVQSVTATELRVITPPAVGFGSDNRDQAVDITIRNLNSGFFTTGGALFRYGVEVFISSIAPNQGPHTGGTIATLFGQGFDEPVAVTLAGIAANIISVTGTEVVVRSNAIVVNGCGDITGETRLVNIETGEAATGPDWIYRVPQPIITSVSPGSGGEAGGTPITITGASFEEPVRVTIDDLPATIESVSPDGTLITARTPRFTGDFPTEACDDNGDGFEGERFLPQTVDVTVTNLVTSCAVTLSNGFTYNPPDATCRGDVAPPTPVNASFTFFALTGTTTVQFTNTSTGTAPLSFEWDFTNDGVVDTTIANPQHDFGASGTYATRLKVTDSTGAMDEVIGQVVVP